MSDEANQFELVRPTALVTSLRMIDAQYTLSVPSADDFLTIRKAKVEADAISMRGLVEIARAWQHGDLYARLWLMLHEAGRIAPSPIEARARMRAALNTKM